MVTPTAHPARSGVASLAALAFLAAGAAAGSQLGGRVEFVGKDGRAFSGEADPRHAVVYFEPAAQGAAARAPGPAVEMTTKGKEFRPQVLHVTRGATVRFPNLDPLLHNVFSVSGGNRFDLGLYSKGPGKSWTFDAPGVVRVFCNVHHQMVGYVLVLDTPYHSAADAEGRFSLAVPDGAGKLTVWHPQAEPWSAEVRTGGAASPLHVRLAITGERVPPHLNKFGRAYERGRRDRYDG
jgi:plastocyanin